MNRRQECANPRRSGCAHVFVRESGAIISSKHNSLHHRLARFGAVGAGGIVVQAATLAILLRVAPAHYLIATALAVEAAILHNFAWHRRWTWADRPRTGGVLALLRFNATNGATSLAGNLVLMLVFVGVFELNPFVANLITIAICSLINFALADRFVFV
jgi:putative flippase GtrA